MKIKKLFLSATFLLGSGLSVAKNRDIKKESKIQKLCAFLMEEKHPCDEKSYEASVLEELAKRGILKNADFKSAHICDEVPSPGK